MIILLSGQFKNIGDFLITERARQLFYEHVDKDIVILDRSQDLESKLDLINRADLLVLCGGPAYASNIYPGIYPLVKDLSQITTPIIPFGLGWCGTPADSPKDFKFDNTALSFLCRVHEGIESSSCRCETTEAVLHNNGIKNVTMTGCPVWYYIPSIGQEFKAQEKIDKIVFTTAADPKLILQTWQMIRMLKRQFPKAKVILSYHRGILPDKHTTYRATIGYLLMAAGAKLINFRTSIKDVSYDLDRLNFYDSCDLHVGYRVHAHLYFLSKRMPSILINEDGRGRGMVETMGLPVFNVGDKGMVQTIENYIVELKKTQFKPFKEIGPYLDRKYEVMKRFLLGLKK